MFLRLTALFTAVAVFLCACAPESPLPKEDMDAIRLTLLDNMQTLNRTSVARLACGSQLHPHLRTESGEASVDSFLRQNEFSWSIQPLKIESATHDTAQIHFVRRVETPYDNPYPSIILSSNVQLKKENGAWKIIETSAPRIACWTRHPKIESEAELGKALEKLAHEYFKGERILVKLQNGESMFSHFRMLSADQQKATIEYLQTIKPVGNIPGTDSSLKPERVVGMHHATRKGDIWLLYGDSACRRIYSPIHYPGSDSEPIDPRIVRSLRFLALDFIESLRNKNTARLSALSTLPLLHPEKNVIFPDFLYKKMPSSRYFVPRITIDEITHDHAILTLVGDLLLDNANKSVAPFVLRLHCDGKDTTWKVHEISILDNKGHATEFVRYTPPAVPEADSAPKKI